MFLPGDIVGISGKHWISRAIRWATRRKWEPPSVVNHTEIVVTAHYDISEVETVAAIGGQDDSAECAGTITSEVVYA